MEPVGVIGVDWETWRGILRLTNLLRAGAYVREHATFVENEGINVIPVMQIIKNFEPMVDVRMPPAWFDECIHDLKMLLQWVIELNNLAATLK